jgi:hypothetical protein
MKSSSDPWYIHIVLYGIITILVIVLVKIAILDPSEYVEQEKYNRAESRLRMTNIKEAEILWRKKFGNFTGNLENLISFIKNDEFVDSVVNAFDSLSRKPANPFKPLSNGQFVPDSLLRSPKSFSFYILKVDTSTQLDTVVNRKGGIVRIDTTTVIGSRYFLEDPDGYGTIGSLENDALKNTASWE